MSQRYIDFVTTPKKAVRPVAPVPKPAATPVISTSSVRVVTSRVIVKPAVKPAPKPTVSKMPTLTPKPAATPVTVRPVAKPAPKEEVFEPEAKTFAPKNEPFYGVIEDYQPKGGHQTTFVSTKVEKRPLSTPRVASKPAATPVNPAVTAEDATLAEAKAKKIRSPLFKKAAKEEKAAPAVKATPEAKEKPAEIETLKTPTTPFIKSAQVEKRPLSKNVYKKPAQTAPAVAETGPVTIIDKPEKDAHIGPIIAIVLTIILGAAVGTVAFLLLPKK